MATKKLKKKIEKAQEKLRNIQADQADLVEQHRQLTSKIHARTTDYLEVEAELKALIVQQRREEELKTTMGDKSPCPGEKSPSVTDLFLTT